jgi:hypothetical protein
MAKARSAAVTQAKLNMIIYGEPFTGKSTLAMQLAYFKRPDGKPFRVLYLDPESGSIDDYLDSLEQNGVQLANIYIVYTQSLGEVRQYISKVKNNEDFYELDEDGSETDDVVLDADGQPFRADAIVVDGATILNLTTKQGLVEFSKKRNKVKADKDGLIGDARLVKIEGAGMELKDYQTVNFKGQDLILDLMASGVHCITTAREADEKEQIKLPDGTTNSVSTGRKIPDGFKGMDYNAKTVVRTFMDKETGQVCAYINKDRTGIHKANEIIEDPTLLDWQLVIDKTANRNSFVLKNDLTKAVDVEQDIYSKEILGGVSNPSNITTEDKDTIAADDITAIKDKIVAKLKSLDPVKKAEVRKQLNENGLPDAFKNVNDIIILNKVWEVVSK